MRRGLVAQDIAIIGVACTYPGARNAAAFWQNIVNKVSAITEMDRRRLDTDTFYDPDPAKQDRLYFNKAGMLGPSFTFNPLKVGIPPNTIEGSEPDHFLVLRAVYEALDDAGYLTRPFSRERTSMILGKGNYLTPGCSWLTLRTVLSEMMMDLARHLRPDLSGDAIARLRSHIISRMPKLSAENAGGLIPNVVTGRVANRLDLMGRNLTLDAACASSLLATENGLHGLLTYQDDMVITGGAHISSHVPFLSVFHATRAMSQTGVIRPFDANADGTMAGEGVGLLILKRLADAERDGDRVYAVIKGAGSASDGKAKGLLAPRVEGEVLALRRAYEMSGVDPATIGLVEGHGTGTPVGDAAELETLRRVFGPAPDGRRTCALGTVKSNIGHAMPAAGAAGLIKTALALHHRVLPPTLNVETPHPILEDPSSPFYLNTTTRPWIQGHGGPPRRAAVNAFGFGGINAHVVLEEYRGGEELAEPSLLREWDEELFVFEGSAREELIAALDRVTAYLARVRGVSLRDVAFTLNTSLAGLPQRAAIVASSFEDLSTKIGRLRIRLLDDSCHQVRERQGLYYFNSEELRGAKVAVMFPGEGAQYLNMLKDLCVHFPVVRRAFDLADSSTGSAGKPLSEVLFPHPVFSEDEEARAEAQLWSIERATEAVLTADGAVYRLLEQLGLRADAMTGHSGGEWVAMAASGMIDFHDFMPAMPRLARMYEEVATNTEIPKMAMLAVGAGKERVAAAARQIDLEFEIANDNCPHQVVAVVAPADSERFREHLLKSGVFVEELPYDRGYHTPAFTYICEPLRNFFENLNLKRPDIPVFSCTTARDYRSAGDAREIIESASETFARKLIFQDTIEAMYAAGMRIFVESGPRGNMTAFVDDILRGRPHLAVPVDQFRRPGLLALQHALGLLMAAHVKLDLAPLYSRRSPRRLTWDAKADSVAPEEEQPGAMQISLCYSAFVMPTGEEFRLPAAPLRSTLPADPLPGTAPSQPEPPPSAEPVESSRLAVERKPLAQVSPSAAALDIQPDEGVLGWEEAPNLAQVALQDHFALMEQFLETEEQVVAQLVNFAPTTAGSHPAAAQAAAATAGMAALPQRGYPELVEDPASAGFERTPARSFPLLRDCEVLEEPHAGKSVVLGVRLDLEEHRYLADHVVTGRPPEGKATRGWRANMPLTGSLELMSEAALMWFAPGELTSIRNVTAYRPIFVEDGQPAPVIRLHLTRRDEKRIDGVIRSVEGQTLCEATMMFGDAFPEPIRREPVQLIRPKEPSSRGAAIYSEYRMFHGPRFHGIHDILSVGENGLIAQLRVLPNDTCLRSDPAPAYVIDPHVFDAAGQLVGFWPTEYWDTGLILLPIRIAEVTLYGASPGAGVILDADLTVRETNDRQLRADYNVCYPDGRVWLRVRGWEDWRFQCDRRLFNFFRFPDRYPMGRTPSSPALETRGIACSLIEAIGDVGKGGFSDLMWLSSIASGEDRERFDRVADDQSRADFLYRSAAAKDAVKTWARQKGRFIHPMDIELHILSRDELDVSGQWEAFVSKPAVCAFQDVGACVAAAGPQPLTVAAERIGAIDGAETRLSAEERLTIQRLPVPDEWVARCIAAKRAAARYLCPTSAEDAAFWSSLTLVNVDPVTGNVSVADPGSAVNAEDVARVTTLTDGGWALAVACA